MTHNTPLQVDQEHQDVLVKAGELLPNVLFEQLPCERRPYTAPMLITLGTSQIGTGATSSLAEANFGVFASAS